MTILLMVTPLFRFEVHIISDAHARAGRLPLAARLEVLGKEMLCFEFYLPAVLLYNVNAARGVKR